MNRLFPTFLLLGIMKFNTFNFPPTGTHLFILKVPLHLGRVAQLCVLGPNATLQCIRASKVTLSMNNSCQCTINTLTSLVLHHTYRIPPLRILLLEPSWVLFFVCLGNHIQQFPDLFLVLCLKITTDGFGRPYWVPGSNSNWLCVRQILYYL